MIQQAMVAQPDYSALIREALREGDLGAALALASAACVTEEALYGGPDEEELAGAVLDREGEAEWYESQARFEEVGL